MSGRLSYHAFVDELLIACAVTVKAKTDALIDVDRAILFINKHFDESWPEAAMKDLATKTMLQATYFTKQPPEHKLTGPGLAYAKELAENRGKNLHDMIADYYRPEFEDKPGGGSFLEQPASPVLNVREEAQESIAPGERLPGNAKSLSDSIRNAFEERRKSNSLDVEDRTDRSRYLAQLQASWILQEETKADHDGLHFLLLSTLLWLHPKIEDAGLRALIQRLMDSTEALLNEDPAP